MKLDVQNIDYDQLRLGAMSVGEQDTQFWRLISDVPKVLPIFAWFAAIINFIFPGTGTMVVGCLGDRRLGNMSKTQFVIGILQLLLAVYFVGYIWSFYWAYLIIKQAHADGNAPTSTNTVLDQAVN